jgi:hypothetical protein
MIAGCGIVGIVSFILYGRARMKEEEERERYFLRIHYAALFLVILLGIIFLFYMVETAD